MDVVRHLISLGCELENRSEESNTGFLLACLVGAFEIVKLLIKNNCKTNVKNINGEDAFFTACHGGNLELLKFIINDLGFNSGAKHPWSGNTGFLEVCSYGHLELMKFFASLPGFDKDYKNFDEDGALHLTCLGKGTVEIVKYLLELGLDVEEKQKEGTTAFWCACASSNLDLVKYFVENIKINVSVKDNITGNNVFFRSSWTS